MSCSGESANISDTRPMCRYGSNCYRRNPIHFAEYKHPEGHPIVKEMQEQSESAQSNSSVGATGQQECTKPIDTDDPPVKRPREDVESKPAQASSSRHDRPDPSKQASSSKRDQSDQSFNFYLTTVRGLEAEWNEQTMAKDIQGILSMDADDFVSSIQFNYMFDLGWLMGKYPSANRKRPLLIILHPTYFHAASVYAEHVNENEGASITVVQARLPIAYGTHHTKMMILKYTTGIRIVIHTCNMIPEDWDQKTQGIYITPLLQKNAAGTGQTGEFDFKSDLIDYLNSYKIPALDGVVKELAQYDMSSVKVKLIASIPGRFQGTEMDKWGHGKLRTVLSQFISGDVVRKDWPAVAQFSSIGSLGPTEDQWLMKEFLTTLASTQDDSNTKPALHLVFPTVENVRTSLEGYSAGGSLPYQSSNAVKQGYLKKYLHQWRSEHNGRTRASPHIKTYFRVSPCWTKLGWFLLSSANLSKAAWGAYEKNGNQLMIRSFELGVLLLPKGYGKDHFNVIYQDGAKSSNNQGIQSMDFPVPYDLPLLPYKPEDEPWVTDRSYKEKRDSRGKFWR